MRATAGVAGDARIARVIHVINRDLSRRVSRAEAARLANLDPGYFSKRFRKVAGVSYARWNARARAEAAQHLLGTTRLKIAAIASLVGYTDITTFERNFRKFAGMSPRTYRTSFCARTDETAVAKKTQNADNKTQNAETSIVRIRSLGAR